ncbi:MAG: ornithine carbamoyltransferase [Candidatus Micrarchaeales archaeon]|jgi:ornithine carbamoyltransferase
MNFISINDVSRDQIHNIFDITDKIRRGEEEITLKQNMTLALFFEKPSTRTRLSFEVAMARLGGRCIYIDSRTSQTSRGEPLSDTARIMSLYVDFIAARMYNHSDLVKMAENSTSPVINALTDLEHPTQALADLYTMSTKKKLKGLRIAFVGDTAQNTANSLMLAATKMGAEMALIGPEGYQPRAEYLTRAREYGVVDLYDSMAEGLANADVVYTDTFVSMGNEKEADKRRKMFAKYQVNSKALQYAKKDAMIMHPLPAFRGEEITADVLEGPQSAIWEQSKNKMLTAQALIMFLSEKIV